MSDSDTAERLETIESKLAFNELLVAELNDTVTRLNAEVAHLRDAQRILIERLQELGDTNAPSNTADERPPHY